MSEQEFIYSTENLITTQQTKVFEPYDLVEENNSILNHRTKEIQSIDDDLVTIASRLIETAKKHKIYNLSANQCGLDYRVFVAGSDDEYVAFFNPSILEYSEEEISMYEVDANLPGLKLKIKRPTSINIEYLDFNGIQRLYRYDGLTARLLQQSYDRLNGVNIKSKVSSFALDRALKAQNKKIKKYVRAIMSHHKIKN